ncbi:MAG TPA: FUSC family protein [Candidatus Binatia bacterium]|nr:FUSC family protein [Candidatus Binatia bacterium]
MLAHLWNRIAASIAFRWRDLALQRAARMALGVILPLALGWMTGHIKYGAFMALGALPAGIVSFQGETRSRFVMVALATFGAALSTFVGGALAAAAPWLLVPVVALWAYVAGLSVCLGPRASVAILQWPIALLIAVGLPADPSEALLRAALVFAGGMLQAGLVAASWMLHPGSRERTTLAESYRILADYAGRIASGSAGPPPAAAFPARTVLEDPNPFLEHGLKLGFIDLLEEAERIRTMLAALAPLAHATQVVAEAADALRRVADALSASRGARGGLAAELNARVASLMVPTDALWRWSGEALLGQLREVGRIVATLDAPRANDRQGQPTAARRAGSIAQSLALLRANMTITTEAGRHALRLAAVAAFAEAFVQTTHLSQGRWVTLTVFIVLKPDSSTISRGLQRSFGTAFGAALGGVAAYAALPGPGGLVVAAGGLIALAYALFEASYVLFSVFLTAFIVVLLGLLGLPVIPTAEARIYDTFVGAALALTGYAAWPSRAGATTHKKLAELIHAHRVYAAALLRRLADPNAAQATVLRALQVDARRLRSDAEAAVARLRSEPRQTRISSELADLVIATVARLAHAELALDALVLTRPAPGPGVRDFSDALDDALGNLAIAMETLQTPQPIPPLRAIETALRGTTFGDIADRLVDAVNTLDAVLREHLPNTAGASQAMVAERRG